MASRSTIEDDTDPVIASYDIYVKAHLEDGKKVYVLQYPNRDAKGAYSVANYSLPLEMRIKEKSGLVEVDIPIDPFRNYDPEKGIKWGEVMRKSDGGSQGLAGGFGIGGAHSTRPRSARQGTEDDLPTQEMLLRDFPASVTQDMVLLKQTLGGQAIPKDNTTPQFMIGAFRNNQLHLTPVDQIVQMRPQFHHIDAQAELERGKSREAATSRVTEPRAIHMTVKPTVDGQEETTDTMSERIRAVQEEPWQMLEYVDEDSAVAWEVFNNSLFIEDPETVPSLASSMSPSQFLDSISAPRSPAKLAKLSKLRNKS